MNNDMVHDPYADNLLVQLLGPILDRHEAMQQLSFLPPHPRAFVAIPKYIRMRYVVRLRDLHVASLEGTRIQESIDLMVRDSYRYRDPKAPLTWSVIGGEAIAHKTPRAPAMVTAVVAHSGAGKTEAIHRSFNLYPNQVITHTTFPNLKEAHHQLVWLSVDVPSSGRSADLASNLMRSFDTAMEQHVPNWKHRFTTALSRTRKDGQQMLDEWRQVASAHFLGALHLDEVQNFFKLAALKKRQKKTASSAEYELSIIEDQCLKAVLSFANTWQIPLVLSGTPDGIGALMRRLSNAQRFATGGYHPMPIFDNPTDPLFLDADGGGFLNLLGKYQYVQKPLSITPEFARLIVKLTAGVPRLIIALWVAAHRIAFERDNDELNTGDFERAFQTFLAPVGPAVEALNSKDPVLMARYEDLVRRDDNFWGTFWGSMG